MIRYFISVFRWTLILLGGEIAKKGAEQIWNSVLAEKNSGEVVWILGLCQYVVVITLAIRYFLRLIDPVWRLAAGDDSSAVFKDDDEIKRRLETSSNSVVLVCIFLAVLCEFVCLYHCALTIGPSRINIWLMYLRYFIVIDILFIILVYCAMADALVGGNQMLFHYHHPAWLAMRDRAIWDLVDLSGVLVGTLLAIGNWKSGATVAIGLVATWSIPQCLRRISKWKVGVAWLLSIALVYVIYIGPRAFALVTILAAISLIMYGLSGGGWLAAVTLAAILAGFSLIHVLLIETNCDNVIELSGYGFVCVAVAVFIGIASYNNIRANSSAYELDSHVLRLKMF